MQTRKLGPFTVNAIGLGCMSMSHAYGTPDLVEAERTLNAALDIERAAAHRAGIARDHIAQVGDKRLRQVAFPVGAS